MPRPDGIARLSAGSAVALHVINLLRYLGYRLRTDPSRFVTSMIDACLQSRDAQRSVVELGASLAEGYELVFVGTEAARVTLHSRQLEGGPSTQALRCVLAGDHQ